MFLFRSAVGFDSPFMQTRKSEANTKVSRDRLSEPGSAEKNKRSQGEPLV